MISIHRNIDTKDLVIMISSDTNTSYIQYASATNSTHLHQMIGSAARAMSLSWDDAIEQYEDMYNKLCKLSKERKRRVESLRYAQINDQKSDSLDFLYFTLVAGGVITLHEVYWLDFYMRKNKLL